MLAFFTGLTGIIQFNHRWTQMGADREAFQGSGNPTHPTLAGSTLAGGSQSFLIDLRSSMSICG
jgi:hypothetical protein